MLTNANHKTPDQRTGESRGPTEYPAPPHRKQYWNETIAAFSAALWLPAGQLRSRPRQNPRKQGYTCNDCDSITTRLVDPA